MKRGLDPGIPAVASLDACFCAGGRPLRFFYSGVDTQQGLTRKGWDEVLVWMVEEQGMYEIEEPDRTVILDYLSTHYNEDRPNFPK